MKYTSLLVLCITCFYQFSFGQRSETSYEKIYYDFKEASQRPLVVRHLDISRQGLDTVPSEIRSFRNLVSLNLSGNDLSILPIYVNSLVNLNSLDLSYMPSLKATQLFDNIKSLRNLRSLNLENGSFVILPQEVTELKSLENINLQSNMFTELPQFVLELRGLKSLNLSNNKLTKLDYGIYQLQDLISLDLSFNEKLDYRDAVFTMSFLFSLQNVELRGLTYVPEELNKLQQINTLDMSEGTFEKIPVKLNDLVNLEHLKLNNCNKLSVKDALAKFSTLTQLQKLEMLNEKVYFFPKGLGKFVNLKELTIGGPLLKYLSSDAKKLTRLISLEIVNSPFIDLKDLMEKFIDIKTLTHVSFRLCGLTDFPTELMKLKNLEKIDLSGNFISSIPEEITNIANLKELDLRGNQIDPIVIKRFVRQMPYCTFLYNKKIEKSTYANLEPPVTTVRVEPSIYTIHGHSATGFQHNSGTQVKIPKNAFLDATGKPVTGQINIEYREFFSPLDIWSTGVPMTVDSAGNQYDLKTAGVFELVATHNGKLLSANPEHPISIEMLSSLSDDDIYNINYYDIPSSKWRYMGRDKIMGKEKVRNGGDSNDPFAGGFMNSKIPVAPVPPPEPAVEDIKVSSYANKRQNTISFKGQYYDDLNTRKIGWGTKFFNDLGPIENISWLYDGKNWRSDSKILDTLSQVSSLLKLAEEDKKVLDDLCLSYGELSSKKTLDILLEPGKEEGKFVLKFIRAQDTINIPVVSNQMPTEKKQVEQFFKDYLTLRAQRSENWNKVESDYRANLKKYELAVDLFRKKLSNYSNNLSPTGGVANIENEKIRRRVAITRLGIFSVNKIQLRNAENLTPQYIDRKGNIYEAQRVYVLDETNNKIIVNAGNKLAFDPQSKNTIIAVLNNGDLGVINSGAFRKMPKKTKKGSTLLELEVLPKESLSMTRLKSVLSFN